MSLLSFLYLLALAIAFIASLRVFKFDNPRYLKFFSIFLEITLCGELLFDFLVYRAKTSSAVNTPNIVHVFNYRIYQTVYLIQYTVVAYFFIKTLKTKFFRGFSWVFIGLYFLVAAIVAPSKTEYWGPINPVWAFFVLTLSCAFFYEIRWKGNRQLNYQEFPEYWLNLSFFLFAAIKMAAFIFAASLSSFPRSNIFGTARGLEIGVLLLLAFGFWRQKSDSSFYLHRLTA
jgi:hypothetical protein